MIIKLFSQKNLIIKKEIKYKRYLIRDNILIENSTIRKFRIVQKEKTRNIKRNIDYYNLDMIIVVGYRVNLKKATNFRIWATKVLRKYMIKGFVMEDE